MATRFDRVDVATVHRDLADPGLRRIEHLLMCLSCGRDLRLETDRLRCVGCDTHYPVLDGVARFVPASFYSRDEDNGDLERKTKNYFGFEWDYFKEWGFIPTEQVDDPDKYSGGTVDATVKAFESKCRMGEGDLAHGKVVLDAGCGNGRYTYQAASRGEATVVGVDLGYGAVTSARDNTRELDNALIVQANLLALPFKSGVIDSCFSNGVLMHTGDAARAFAEVARTVAPGGVFVAHVYQKLNELWEHNDRLIRAFTTRLSIEDNLEFAAIMARLGRFLRRFEGALPAANRCLRLQHTEHHMFDWYSAPVATHHTFGELASWFGACGFDLLDDLPDQPHQPTGDWACNLKGRKREV